MAALKQDFQGRLSQLKELLRSDQNFDIVVRLLKIVDRDAAFFFVDGLLNDEVMGRIMENFHGLEEEDMLHVHDIRAFAHRVAPWADILFTKELDKTAQYILSGMTAMLIDGFEEILFIDNRRYPTRSVSEPESNRVLRGAHIGFIESLITNTALIRRHIRDPRLIMESMNVGQSSKTDVVLCYMDGVADPSRVALLRHKLNSITIPNLAMGQESLSECLFGKQQWFNPFPKIKYTERPDNVAASVVEGSIVVLIDNSPAVMILPTSIFDFVQDTNDFYFPPLVGTYLRLVRMIFFVVAILLTPIWFWLITSPELLPPSLAFLAVADPGPVPIILQLLIIETMIEGLKMASLNMPMGLTNAFSILGALVFGEFAVSAGFFLEETMLYTAIVLVSNFTQPSFELSYAFKLFRILTLLLIVPFHGWGLLGGLLLMLVLLCTTKTALGTSYLYPLIPFNWAALKRLMIRRMLNSSNAGK